MSGLARAEDGSRSGEGDCEISPSAQVRERDEREEMSEGGIAQG